METIETIIKAILSMYSKVVIFYIVYFKLDGLIETRNKAYYSNLSLSTALTQSCMGIEWAIH